MKNVDKEIKTSGQLRLLLAKTMQEVLAGNMEVEDAVAVHKLAKTITDSLYSETKIAMFRHELKQPPEAFGDLPLGGSEP